MLTAPTHTGEEELEKGLSSGIAVFRWATWLWMAVVLLIDTRNDSLAHPVVAWALVGLALVFTIWASVAALLRPALLRTPVAVVTEVAIAVSLVGLDSWVYDSAHSQRLGASWALASILSAGIAFAGRGGFAAGVTVGSARAVSILFDGATEWNGDQQLAVLSSIVLYSLAGAVAGFAAIKLREAERDIAAARAREEVARQLHDGVLQTLAVVQRRSKDHELVELAREQEQDLRGFLSGMARAGDPDDTLEQALRSAAKTVEQRDGLRVRVVVTDGAGPESLDSTVIGAVRGAVTEALTNAAKHGASDEATVFADVSNGELFCSIKDNGAGFDPADTVPGLGLDRSIRGRIEELGGRVEIGSRPGAGTEIRLWVSSSSGPLR